MANQHNTVADDHQQERELVLNHEPIVDEDFPAFDPEARFLFNRYNGIITLTTSSSNLLIKTKTVASLVQTTITSTSTRFCVPAIEFSGSAYLTTCSASGRRRRDVVSLLDMLKDIKRQQRSGSDFDLEEEDSFISPYAVEPLETTPAPSTGLFGSSGRMKKDLSASNDVIDSSRTRKKTPIGTRGRNGHFSINCLLQLRLFPSPTAPPQSPRRLLQKSSPL